jgi:hypothetical protein
VCSEIPQLAVDRQLVQLVGNTYTLDDKKWVGFDKFSTAIKEDEKLRNALYKQLTNVDKKVKTS